MKWQISDEKHKASVSIPDHVVDGESFDVAVNGRFYLGRWARSLGTLYLKPKDGDGLEAAYRLRSVAVNRISGESSVGVGLEYSAAGKFRAETLAAQAEIDVPAREQRAKSHSQGSQVVRSPMSGKILQVLVANGVAVKKGEVVLIIEAMKMENRISAVQAGVLQKLATKVGESVNTGDILFEIVLPS